MPKGLLIKPDGSIETVYPDSYHSIRCLIGGPLEGLQICPDGTLNAYIHEEGKLEELPLNPLATVLCRLKNTGLAQDDFIAGPMVLFGPVGEMGEDSDLPMEHFLFVTTKLLDETNLFLRHSKD